jgi:hypothetical protein
MVLASCRVGCALGTPPVESGRQLELRLNSRLTPHWDSTRSSISNRSCRGASARLCMPHQGRAPCELERSVRLRYADSEAPIHGYSCFTYSVVVRTPQIRMFISRALPVRRLKRLLMSNRIPGGFRPNGGELKSILGTRQAQLRRLSEAMFAEDLLGACQDGACSWKDLIENTIISLTIFIKTSGKCSSIFRI